MNWNDLTKQEQNQARQLRGKLGTSVSQIAKYWDEVTDWDAGLITDAQLAERTGIEVPA